MSRNAIKDWIALGRELEDAARYTSYILRSLGKLAEGRSHPRSLPSIAAPATHRKERAKVVKVEYIPPKRKAVRRGV
jgi:hypothetical protein